MILKVCVCCASILLAYNAKNSRLSNLANWWLSFSWCSFQTPVANLQLYFLRLWQPKIKRIVSPAFNCKWLFICEYLKSFAQNQHDFYDMWECGWMDFLVTFMWRIVDLNTILFDFGFVLKHFRSERTHKMAVKMAFAHSTFSTYELNHPYSILFRWVATVKNGYDSEPES